MQNRFGASIGGPLKIPWLLSGEKTSFFVSYNAIRSSNPFSAFATLPSAVERAGNFSNSGQISQATIYDPTTRQPFPNNIIPFSRINSAARGLLNFIPSPNQPGAVQNYQFVTAVPTKTESISVRLNQAISPRDRMAINVSTQKRTSQQSQTFGFLDDSSGRGWNADLNLTHTFTRRTVNNVRLSYNRNRNEMLPFFAFGRNWANDLGIQGTSQDPLNYGPPNLSFTNFGGLNDASPVLRRDQTMSVSEGFIYSKGKHNLSIGGDYRRIQHNNRTDQNGRGTFTFTGLATSGFDDSRNPLPLTGFDFADFLLGLPQSGSVRFGSSSNYFRASSYSAYAQDDWRLRPNLSLNIGLRYEYASPYHEQGGQMANLDVAPGFTGVAVVTPIAITSRPVWLWPGSPGRDGEQPYARGTASITTTRCTRASRRAWHRNRRSPAPARSIQAPITC
jgi:outer membrane receptor protein involved in Fe transport